MKLRSQHTGKYVQKEQQRVPATHSLQSGLPMARMGKKVIP